MAALPLLAGSLALLLAARARPHVDDDFSALRTLLKRVPQERRTGEQILRELVLLGPERIPLLYGLATGSGIQPLVAGQSVERWVVTPDELVSLARRALERQPSARVLAFLERELAQPGAAEARQVALRVLGALGTAEGLKLYWDTLAQLGELGLRHPRIRADACDALVGMLRGDVQSWPRLERRVAELSASEREVVAESVQRAARHEGVRALELLLRSENDLARHSAFLLALAELERLMPWELEGTTVRAARFAWAENTAAERVEMALALGRSDDPAAAAPLIELAGERGARAQRLCRAALGSLAAVPLPDDANDWPAWHAAELAWRGERWEGLGDELVGEDAARCVQALHELLGHPLFRREAAKLVAECLAQLPPQAAGEACRALVSLQNRAALPGLVDALGRGSEELRAQAAQALGALTGQDHPPEAAAWRAALFE